MPFKYLIKEFQDLRDGLGSISRRSFDIKLPIYHHRSRSINSFLDETQARLAQYVNVSDQSCWANMPPELLRDILRRVESSESTWHSRKHFVACACVCRSWRSIAKELVRPPEHSKKLTFPISVKQVIIIGFYPPEDHTTSLFCSTLSFVGTYHCISYTLVMKEEDVSLFSSYR